LRGTWSLTSAFLANWRSGKIEAPTIRRAEKTSLSLQKGFLGLSQQPGAREFDQVIFDNDGSRLTPISLVQMAAIVAMWGNAQICPPEKGSRGERRKPPIKCTPYSMDGWMISFTLTPRERYAGYHNYIYQCTHMYRVPFPKRT
jgi:hypothetical protein